MNKYENLTEFYKPAHELYRMSTQEGVTFWNYYKVPINLTNQFRINRKSDESSQIFKTVSVVSNSEEIVVFGYYYGGALNDKF